MKKPAPQFSTPSAPKHAYWAAIFSLFMGVTSLIASEFIPISLLTPIANDLQISEGVAGQSITIVGIFAVITSLLLSPLAKNINRKIILLSFSVIVILSNLVVAFAPNYFIMLIGRGLLGICVGGFWSMASAVALQLAPQKDVPRALSIIYAGVSVATIIALPLANYLGNLLGWRHVFIISAFIGLVTLVWQLITLPSLPAQTGNSFSALFTLLKQSWILVGIIAMIFSYGGYHIFFSYLRPFLQGDLKLTPSTLTVTLLVFGMANCLGTFIAGLFLGRFFKLTMITIHFLLAITAITLFLSQSLTTENTVLVIMWGFFFGFIPVGWSTWITRTLADKAELMGGLSVAAIQFSIGFAAAGGGLLFDHLGSNGLFIAAACIMLLAIVLIKLSFSLYSNVTGTSV